MSLVTRKQLFKDMSSQSLSEIKESDMYRDIYNFFRKTGFKFRYNLDSILFKNLERDTLISVLVHFGDKRFFESINKSEHCSLLKLNDLVTSDCYKNLPRGYKKSQKNKKGKCELMTDCLQDVLAKKIKKIADKYFLNSENYLHQPKQNNIQSGIKSRQALRKYLEGKTLQDIKNTKEYNQIYMFFKHTRVKFVFKDGGVFKKSLFRNLPKSELINQISGFGCDNYFEKNNFCVFDFLNLKEINKIKKNQKTKGNMSKSDMCIQITDEVIKKIIWKKINNIKSVLIKDDNECECNKMIEGSALNDEDDEYLLELFDRNNPTFTNP